MVPAVSYATNAPTATSQERKRAPTLIDIARVAGVSKSTVSRVLNGEANVSPAARAQVQAAIDRLDYRINLVARGLRTARTSQVGLLVPAINNEVFGEIAERLDEVLREAGVTLAITSSGWSSRAELSALDALSSRGVDAIVLAVVEERNRELLARLRSIEAPLVLLDREIRGVRADAVITDQRSGVVQCMEHLARLGHTSIGMLTSPSGSRPGREHAAAYHETVARLDLVAADELLLQSMDYTHQGGYAASEKLVEAGATAILGCAPVAVIVGMLDHLSDRKLRIPRDVSFVEYTDSAIATVSRPRLSVILRPLEEIGRIAGRLVLTRIANERLPRKHELIATRFLDRESTAPPRS